MSESYKKLYETVRYQPDLGFRDTLEKAKGHKYLSRIRVVRNGKLVYEYKYSSRDRHHADLLKVGSAFAFTHEGKEGHFHVIEEPGDGLLKVRHDESGHTQTISRAKLQEMLHPTPKATKSKSSTPKATKSKSSMPKATKSKSSSPKPSMPKATKSKSSSPKPSMPKSSSPKSSTPKSSSPKSSSPKSSSPKSSTPKSSTPKSSTPKATKSKVVAVYYPHRLASQAYEGLVKDSDKAATQQSNAFDNYHKDLRKRFEAYTSGKPSKRLELHTALKTYQTKHVEHLKAYFTAFAEHNKKGGAKFSEALDAAHKKLEEFQAQMERELTKDFAIPGEKEGIEELQTRKQRGEEANKIVRDPNLSSEAKLVRLKTLGIDNKDIQAQGVQRRSDYRLKDAEKRIRQAKKRLKRLRSPTESASVWDKFKRLLGLHRDKKWNFSTY